MRGNANRLQIFLFNFSSRRYIKIELRSTVFTLTQSVEGEDLLALRLLQSSAFPTFMAENFYVFSALP